MQLQLQQLTEMHDGVVELHLPLVMVIASRSRLASQTTKTNIKHCFTCPLTVKIMIASKWAYIIQYNTYFLTTRDGHKVCEISGICTLLTYARQKSPFDIALFPTFPHPN
jgi:hypothetical protein